MEMGGSTHNDELVHEDVTEVAARLEVEPEDACGAVRRELDRGEHRRGDFGLDPEQERAVLQVDQQAREVAAQDLSHDVPGAHRVSFRDMVEQGMQRGRTGRPSAGGSP